MKKFKEYNPDDYKEIYMPLIAGIGVFVISVIAT
jgi:hypothetical protein